MDDPTTTTITVLYPCQEDDVLLADGECINFADVPAGATVIADYCTAVNGTDFCEQTFAAEPATPVTVLARTGVESDLALFAIIMILLGRSLVRWGKRNA